jgi:hypothetical protein
MGRIVPEAIFPSDLNSGTVLNREVVSIISSEGISKYAQYLG